MITTGKKHICKKHKDVIVNKSVCIHCGKDCGTNSDSMKRHIEKCQKCKSTKVLDEHLSNKVKTETSTDNNMYKVKYTCEICTKQFHNIVNYTKHLDVCRKPVECKICKKAFLQWNNIIMIEDLAPQKLHMHYL